MRTPRCFVGLLVAAVTVAVTTGAWAQTSDATLTVRIAVTSSSRGAFNNAGLLGTRVTVFARSGAQTRYSSATGITAPTSGTAAAGATFNVTVPNLFSPTATGAPNSYTIELSWADTTNRELTLGPITMTRGTANSIGPATIDNQPPPGVRSIACYPNLPRSSAEMYVYWSAPGRAVDFDRYEIHRGPAPGFTITPSTLVAALPFGQSNRVDNDLSPSTSYYYCLRTLDRYGAFSDVCTTTPCRTEPLMMDAGPDVRDVGADLPQDLGVDAAPDLLDSALDVAADLFDAGTDAPVDHFDAGTDLPMAVVDAGTDAPVDRLDAVTDAPAAPTDRGASDVVGMAGFTSNAPTSALANTPYAHTPTAVSASGEAATGYRSPDLPPGASMDPRTGAIAWTPPFSDVGMMRTFTVVATLPGGGEVRQTITVTVGCPDNDRDGRRDLRCDRGPTGGDCDDARADTSPAATERCNGIDDNCDGRIDEGLAGALCGAGEICDPSVRACRPACTSASDCRTTPQTCTREGTCGLCAPGAMGDAAGCAASEDGRACIADSLGGVFCGCDTDADCGDATSGRVCDASRRRCIKGCGVGPGRNGCPAPQRCFVTETSAGPLGACSLECTASPTCAVLPALPVCPNAGARRCVECAADADCGANADGRMYCDVTRGACVRCLTEGRSQCTAAGAGSACLAGGVCGCNVDADCGSTQSGRICDPVTRACRAGCRRMSPGGNACSPDEVCVPINATTGRCTSRMGDAAVDVADATAGLVDVATPEVVQDDVNARDAGELADAAADLGPDASGYSAGATTGCACRTHVPTPRAGRWAMLGALMGLAVRRRRRAPEKERFWRPKSL